jgi:hypothetical protein
MTRIQRPGTMRYQMQPSEMLRASQSRAGSTAPSPFKAALQKRQESAAQRHPGMDRNGDGRVGFRERKAGSERLAERHPGLDRNDDGRVGLRERKAGIEKSETAAQRHPEADLDGNGRISSSEAQAARQPSLDV